LQSQRRCAPTLFTSPERGIHIALESTIHITRIGSERTFWEKVTLLHAENHRTDLTNFKPRMSRHFSRQINITDAGDVIECEAARHHSDDRVL
jgi:hypothetical protein